MRGDADLRNETRFSRNYMHLMNLIGVAIAAFDEDISIVSEGTARTVEVWLQL